MTTYAYDNFMIEVTRWCNMECPHCLRGDRERGRIKKETITKIVESAVDNLIPTIMFTGGEPALALDLIEFTLDECVRLGVSVGNFWMATNGLISSPKFFRVIRRWLDYTDDGGINRLRISPDRYHDIIDIYPFKDFEEELEMEGVSCYFEYHGAPDNSNDLTSDGRAVWNYPATKPVEHDISRYNGFADYDYRVEGTTYFSIKGDVISTCDISFNQMDRSEFNLGNIHTETLEQMYDRFFEEHPERIHE